MRLSIFLNKVFHLNLNPNQKLSCKFNPGSYFFNMKINKAVLLQSCRRQEGEECSSYSFLSSILDGGQWLASCYVRALASGKQPWYPMYRRLGGFQSWSGHRGQNKNPLPLPG
jgi:hypothetical protein